MNTRRTWKAFVKNLSESTCIAKTRCTSLLKAKAIWFHKEDREDEVSALLCEQGDLISVPADTKHWFDSGNPPKVRAIRLFTDQTGWIPRYTSSGIDQRYRW